MRTYVRTYVRMCVDVSVCTYIYMYIDMFARMYIRPSRYGGTRSQITHRRGPKYPILEFLWVPGAIEGTVLGTTDPLSLVSHSSSVLAQAGEVKLEPHPEGPIRVPLWNSAPKVIYGMVSGT